MSGHKNIKPILARISRFFRHHPWLPAVAVALAVHAGGLSGRLVYDDVPLIQNNHLLGTPGYSGAIWQRDYGLEFARTPKGLYRPLLMFIITRIHAIAGKAPIAYHLTSLLFFLLATLLVVQLTKRLSGNFYTAMVAGIIYAVHPARVELCTMIMSLPDLIVEICALVILLAFTRQRGVLTTALLCFAAATAAALTKESAFFIMPALAGTALLASWWGDSSQRATLRYGGVAIIGGLLPAIAMRLMADLGANNDGVLTALSNLTRGGASNAVQALMLSAKSTIIPGLPIFWHTYAPATKSILPLIFPGVIAVALITVWLWFIARSHIFAALLTAWIGAGLFGITLTASGGIEFSQRYLPLAPLVVSACCLFLSRWQSEHRKPLLVRIVTVAALFMLVATYAYASIIGTRQCKSPLAFFSAIRLRNPSSVFPLGAIAQTLHNQGAPPATIENLVRMATKLDPKHPQVTLLHNMVIKDYLDRNNYPAALSFASWSLSIYPGDYDKAVLKAVALAGLKRFDASLAIMDSAIEANPDNRAYRDLRDQIRANREK